MASCAGKLIENLGGWENTRKACKSRAEGELFTSFSSVLPTSQVGYHAGKPIEYIRATVRPKSC